MGHFDRADRPREPDKEAYSWLCTAWVANGLCYGCVIKLLALALCPKTQLVAVNPLPQGKDHVVAGLMIANQSAYLSLTFDEFNGFRI